MFEIRYKSNEAIEMESSNGIYLIFILEGKIEIIKEYKNQKTSAILTVGEMCGDLMNYETKYLLSAHATTNCLIGVLEIYELYNLGES